MDLELTEEDLTRVVDQAVAELLAAAGVEHPPVDAQLLALKHLELQVHLENPGAGAEAVQAVMAHAIGVHLKPVLLTKLGIDPQQKRPMMGTSLAGLFAERLLLPSLWFDGDASSRDCDVLELKQRYRTASHELIAFRLLDLPELCVITLVDDGEVYRRKSNGPRVKKKLEPPELECERLVTKHGEPRRVCKRGWTVQGWPVPRAGGSRVILRSLPDED